MINNFLKNSKILVKCLVKRLVKLKLFKNYSKQVTHKICQN